MSVQGDAMQTCRARGRANLVVGVCFVILTVCVGGVFGLKSRAGVEPPAGTEPGTGDRISKPVAAGAFAARARKVEVVAGGDLVTAIRGSLPIIISAPHGGSVRVPGSRDRSSGVMVRDVNTAEIALLVSQRITEKLGGKPYVVAAQFSRKDADANRAAGDAYENDAAAREYEAYHRALAEFVRECRETHGRAILIDLHGQVREPKAFVRGTRNGKTVSQLMRRAGEGALTGPDSIFGQLKGMGYVVLPDHENEPEGGIGKETFFDGGFIVGNYGSQNEMGVDAIQIEMGAARSDSPWKTGRDVGEAIAHFAKKFGFDGQK